MDNIKQKNVEETMQALDRRMKIHLCQQQYRLQRDDFGKQEVCFLHLFGNSNWVCKFIGFAKFYSFKKFFSVDKDTY